MPKAPSKLHATLSHWPSALPVLLLAAALAIPQIGLYPPAPDEFYSMYTSGWVEGGPFSPPQVIDALQTYAPDNTPAYFLLLSAWGNLTAPAIEMARALGILLHLLFLAAAYRLARDFADPIASIFLLTVISGNAFLNFYIPHARMYTLLLLLTAAMLWLYLKLAFRAQTARRRHYILLGALVFCLLATHAVSALFLCMLGVFHVLAVPKNRRWLMIAATVSVAALLFAPYLLNMFRLLDDISGMRAQHELLDALGAWLTLSTNGQPLLLLLPVAGLLIERRPKRRSPPPWLLMSLIYFVLLGIVEAASGFVEISAMRYHFTGWLALALTVAYGLRALYSIRNWLGLLTLACFVLAGVHFQANARWWSYITVLGEVVASPPTGALSRMALNAPQTPALLGHSAPMLHRFYLRWDGFYLFPDYIDYSQEEHYFTRHGVQHHAAEDMAEFEDQARRYAVNSPWLWVYHQPGRAVDNAAAKADSIIADLNYEVCASERIGLDTVVAQYAWRTLDCQAPAAVSTHSSALLHYDFVAAELHAAGDKLYISDRWRVNGDASDYNMSYQLLTKDWNKAAQLDLPLGPRGEWRMYYIDLKATPPGTYRLMLIVYDRETGERLAWDDNPGDVPEMLQLGEVELR